MMKKTRTLLILLITGTVTFGMALWYYSTKAEINVMDYALSGAVGLMVILTILVGFKRLSDQKKGLTVEDELSQRIKEKAASRAFVLSIYLWTVIMLVLGDTELDREIPWGIGIIGMGCLFISCLVYYNKKGIEIENPD